MGLCCRGGAFRSAPGSASFRFPLPLDLPPRSVAEDFAAAFIYCDSIKRMLYSTLQMKSGTEQCGTSEAMTSV
jgi:hypothetical protein